MIIRSDIHHGPLYRRLVQCADEIAGAHCGHSFSGEDSCRWYHSAWPMLRLLDAVSTPYWHTDFYQFAIQQKLSQQSRPNPKIFVAAAADFAMAALVYEVLQHRSVAIQMLDQCRTALEYTRIWSHEVGAKIQLIESDILSAPRNGDSDVAVSDALLTRFSSSERPDVLRAVFDTLRPDGVFVTTIRDHSRPTGQSVDERLIRPDGLTSKGYRALLALGFSNEASEGLAKSIQRYCEKMKSNRFDGISELIKICTIAGLKIDYVESALVAGEYAQTLYLRAIISRQVKE